MGTVYEQFSSILLVTSHICDFFFHFLRGERTNNAPTSYLGMHGLCTCNLCMLSGAQWLRAPERVLTACSRYACCPFIPHVTSKKLTNTNLDVHRWTKGGQVEIELLSEDCYTSQTLATSRQSVKMVGIVDPGLLTLPLLCWQCKWTELNTFLTDVNYCFCIRLIEVYD